MGNVVLTEKSDEEEISRCVKAAIEKLDKVDANAEKEKTQIVKDLAKDLEGKIPTDSICNEIVHQLHGKASPRLIRVSLDEKYKEKHRVANARKQKKHKSTEDLAAPLPLNNGDIDPQEKKKIIIDTLGNVVIQPQPSIIKGIDDSGKEVIAQSNRRDVMECQNCKIKDSRIKELEDILAKPTQLTPANEIIEEKDNKIMQPLTEALAEKGFNDNNIERKEEPTSLNNEITSVNRRKEDLTDTEKEILVSHIPVPFENLRRDMAAVLQSTKGAGNVFFKVCIDLGTRLVEIDFCGITQHATMTSTGKGILKEAATIFPLGS